ncbi:MAG: hypothetical protein RJA81_1011, partial [Planctomycetota bacterium]
MSCFLTPAQFRFPETAECKPDRRDREGIKNLADNGRITGTEISFNYGGLYVCLRFVLLELRAVLL